MEKKDFIILLNMFIDDFRENYKKISSYQSKREVLYDEIIRSIDTFDIMTLIEIVDALKLRIELESGFLNHTVFLDFERTIDHLLKYNLSYYNDYQKEYEDTYRNYLEEFGYVLKIPYIINTLAKIVKNINNAIIRKFNFLTDEEKNRLKMDFDKKIESMKEKINEVNKLIEFCTENPDPKRHEIFRNFKFKSNKGVNMKSDLKFDNKNDTIKEYSEDIKVEQHLCNTYEEYISTLLCFPNSLNMKVDNYIDDYSFDVDKTISN